MRSELAIPLIVKNRVIGVLNLEAQEAGRFTEEHKRLLMLIGSRMAVGIENARLHTRTTRQARTLVLLNEISRELTSILNVDELLKRIAELLSRLIDYQMFSILLLDSAGEKLQHRFSLRFQENIQLKHDIPLGQGLVGYAAQHREAVLVPDVNKDLRYIRLNPETRSELAVPLIYKDKVIGVLDLEHTKRGFFTEDHKRTVTTLAAQVAIALENARLYEEIARQEKRLERDLALARELQFRLLPQSLPKLPNLEFAAKFAPARAIGGDLYDFVNYSQSRMGIVIGDVSGKGAPAAIYAALVSGILRSHAPIEPGPAEMLRAVNFSLGERRIDGQFVSLIYAVWDDRESFSAGRQFRVASSALCPRRQDRSHRSHGLAAGPVRRCRVRRVHLQSQSRATCSSSSATAFSMPATRPATCLDASSGSDYRGMRRDFRRLCGQVAVQGGDGTCRRRRGLRRRNRGRHQGERRTQAQVSRSAHRSEGRPPAFSYREMRKGFLRRKSVGPRCIATMFHLEQLAERFGTPLYVYSASTIRERMRSFEHAFRKVPHTVCYSVKANSSLAILRLLAGMGCGFDVVSGGELERVLRVDRRAAKKVVFSGVGKTAEEMQAALKAGVLLFNVESEAELWRLAECAARTGAKSADCVAGQSGCSRQHASLYLHRPAAAQIRHSDRRGAQDLCPGFRDKISPGRRRKRAHRFADHRRAAVCAGDGASGRPGARAARGRPPHPIRGRRWRPGHCLRGTDRAADLPSRWPNMPQRCCVRCAG